MRKSKVKNPQKNLKAESTATRPDWTILLGALVIIIGAFVAYFPAIRAGFIWDDPDYVVNNQLLRSFDGLVRIWTAPTELPQWYPLVHTTFWIEYHLWQLWPMGYHIDNVILHIGSALLLWRLLRKLEVPGAWLAGAIFALHPVHVESVAWITERKNVLSCFLYLLSLATYLKWDALRADPQQKPGKKLYWIAFAFFIAALLSKTVVATLPASIAVILWWKRGTLRRRDISPLVPMLLVGAGMGLLTAYLEVHHVGAQSDRIVELNLSLLERTLIAGRAVWFYAAKLVWPWPLMFIYVQWKPISPAIVWQWIFPIGVAGVLGILFSMRQKITRGPLAAFMIFCGTLFPALGFFNVYPMRFSYVADHFQYHASMAMIALLAAILWRYGRAYASVVLLPLAIITLIRTPVYHDAETLWRHTLAQNPNSWIVRINLGELLIKRADETGNKELLDQAIEQYEAGVRVAPHIHETHANLGSALAKRGVLDRAMSEFEAALAINPSFVPAMVGIAQIHQRQQRPDLAITGYQKALQIDPRSASANYGMGRLLEQRGDLAEAAMHYRLAVTAAPEDFDSRYNLGTVLLQLRQFPEAAYNLQEAARLRGDSAPAWTNLGWAQLNLGQTADAAGSFRRALSIDSSLPQAQIGLQRAMQR